LNPYPLVNPITYSHLRDKKTPSRPPKGEASSQQVAGKSVKLSNSTKLTDLKNPDSTSIGERSESGFLIGVTTCTQVALQQSLVLVILPCITWLG
ncbi:MAG TPA: hypothetical protein VFQ47_07990, partial [Nitrososphaera sp.]|nr:hypothetical protein [Nitrososphaera sp.]